LAEEGGTVRRSVGLGGTRKEAYWQVEGMTICFAYGTSILQLQEYPLQS
jgi:hypothetical protein